MKVFIQLKYKARLILLVLAVCFGVDNAFADHRSDYRAVTKPLLQSGAKSTRNASYSTRRYSQNTQTKLRSRSAVVNEVKQRYNAKVLKISLNQQKTQYKVRVLMPSGKVRNLQVNAKR